MPDEFKQSDYIGEKKIASEAARGKEFASVNYFDRIREQANKPINPLTSALVGLAKAFPQLQQAAQYQNPLISALVGGGIGSQVPGQLQAQQQEQVMSQIDNAPMDEVAPDFVAANPWAKGIPVGTFQKIAGPLSAMMKKENTLDESDIGYIESVLGNLKYSPEDVKRLAPSFVGQPISALKGLKTQAAPGVVGGEPEYTQGGIDLAAEQFLATGALPALGMGKTKVRADIINKAADIAAQKNLKAEDVASSRASFKADATSLAQISKQRDFALAFEKTANSNLDIADSWSDKVGRTGSPVINNLWLKVKGKYAGDPDTLAFEAAIKTAANEYAKVVTGQTGGAAVSDSARAETDRMLNSAYSPEAFKQVIGVMKQEMLNREKGYDEQISLLKQRLNPNTKQKEPVSQQTKIRVKQISTGKVGTILESDFNPTKYERIQ